MAVQSAGSPVWGAASAARPDATLRVKYDSTRSDDVQTVEGVIERVSGLRDRGIVKVIFRRDDGQYMAVSTDGAVESIGSHFPRTGTVIDAEVDG